MTLDHEITCESLPITGTVPEWLSGTLLRNGPAKFDLSAASVRHWFDGFAMLHAFSFHAGRVSYMNRFLRSRSYTRAMKDGKLSFSAFAADPCRSIFSRTFSMLFDYADNANVSITRVANRFLALTETPIPVEFDPHTLQTIGLFTYEDRVPGVLTTAHPLYDALQEATVGYTLGFNVISSYQVHATHGRRRTRLGVVRVAEPAYMHSFGMTERYVILSEFPFVVNPFTFLRAWRPFIDNFQWKPERSTRFFLIDKIHRRLVKVYESEAFFSFHHINAFETDDGVVLDLIAYPDPSVINLLYLEQVCTGEALPPGELRRYYLPRNGTTASYERRSAVGLELPQIHEAYSRSHPYRFVYGVGSKQPCDFLNQVLKVDVEGGAVAVWEEEGCYPGEPVFVASPGGSTEDGGVILSVVLDGRSETSFLLILDAVTFDEIGRAQVPHHIPFGFHGYFCNDVD